MAGKRIALFVLVDALGWELLSASGALASRPEVKAGRVRTILGYSSGAIPSILTGLPPSGHGRWNLLRWSPESSPFGFTRHLGALPEPFVSNRFARKAIDMAAKRLAGAEGYFSSYGMPVRHLKNFDVCETENIYRPGAIREAKTVFDRWEEEGAEYLSLSYHDGSDPELLAKAKNILADGAPPVCFLYLAGLDEFLHYNGCSGEAVMERVRYYVDEFDALAGAAGAEGREVRAFLFSDHGMTPVTRHYDLIGQLRATGVGPEEDYVAAFDSTMARFWVKKGELRSRLLATLSALDGGRVLGREELEALGAFFPDGRYGNLIYLMHPGTLISPNLFGSYKPLGMHGYHPDDAHSWAVFATRSEVGPPETIEGLCAVMLDAAAWAHGKEVAK